MQCECKTVKGARCKLKVSKKVGADKRFCARHQDCQTLFSDAVAASRATKPKKADKKAKRATAQGLADPESLLANRPILLRTVLAMNDRAQIQALCQSNKQLAKACRENKEVAAHMNSLGPPISHFESGGYWFDKGKYQTFLEMLLEERPRLLDWLKTFAKSSPKEYRTNRFDDLLSNLEVLQEYSNLQYEWGNNGDYFPNVQRDYRYISPPEVDFEDIAELRDGPPEKDWYFSWINENIDDTVEEIWQVMVEHSKYFSAYINP